MTNSELTRERIEAAIRYMKAERAYIDDMINNVDEYGVDPDDLRPFRSHMDTILAALDAVRWRDVSEHPKDGEDVLAMMKGDWICVVTFRASDSAYLGFGDCNETDDIKGWIPYPAWEEYS